MNAAPRSRAGWIASVVYGNGGTMFLGSVGRYIGPGHIGVFSEGGTNWFSYHYYDGENRGRSKLALGQLEWTSDGWPVAKSPPSVSMLSE